MRMVGACKEGTEVYFKPTAFPELAIPLHPFHDHIFNFLKGTEVDITRERYRHEAKFAEPKSNPNNHNFAIAVSARRVCVWLCL